VLVSNGERQQRSPTANGELAVSIVRVGLAETKKFAQGYDAIFGKKKGATAKKPKPVTKKTAAKKKKKPAKKK
jgi:hypothetical protein